MYQLISLPLKHREDRDVTETLVREDRAILYSFLKEKLSLQHDLAQVHQMNIPELKIGTLDSLVAAGEELAKLDPQFEAVVARLVTAFKGLVDNDLEQVRSSLIVADSTACASYSVCSDAREPDPQL